jgi:hypothetical protein
VRERTGSTNSEGKGRPMAWNGDGSLGREAARERGEWAEQSRGNTKHTRPSKPQDPLPFLLVKAVDFITKDPRRWTQTSSSDDRPESHDFVATFEPIGSTPPKLRPATPLIPADEPHFSSDPFFNAERERLRHPSSR